MVFPTNEVLTPCLTRNLPEETRKRWKERYRYAKKYGLRGGFGLLTGTGFYTLVKEAATDGIKCHSKRYLGLILMNIGLTCVTTSIPLLTNTTKIIKYSRAVHSVCAAAWRAAHNTAELSFIICDFAIFGEHVPSCGEADYDMFSHEATDFIKEFTK